MANRFFPNYEEYKITSRFGVRKHPVDGVQKMHNGIDLVAAHLGGWGTTDYITAHTGGTVCGVGYNNSAGNYVRVQTAPNVVMYYHHLRNMSHLTEGATVQRGEVLGYMGTTGKSTGAHLHFGIKVDGQWVDPEPWLDKDYQTAKMLDFQLPVLKRGVKFGSVWALQSLLIGYGYDLGEKGLDGSFGKDTEAALKKYQFEHDLDADGSCGRKTWSSLLGID